MSEYKNLEMEWERLDTVRGRAERRLRQYQIKFATAGAGKAADTLDYYNRHAEAYANNTQNVEFAEMQDKFLSYLAPGSRILDFGCGSGRDTKYFLSKGFRVDAADGSEIFVKMASKYTGIKVRQMLFQELNAEEIYDGIWACASILHLPGEDLEDVFRRMARALVSNGILYTSFKYGTEERTRDGRYFTDMTEEKMKAFLNKGNLFRVEELWVTSDVRPGRETEKWLNVILRKKRKEP